MKATGTGRWIAGVVAAAAAWAVGGARGAGLLIADGGLGGQLEIVEHDVKVSVNNGVAVTRVNQIFHNKEARAVEALYTFPVPKGASVANFSMWINGKEMTGEVVEKERARQIYNSYKPQKRDPGLLEQVDFRTFEMRVFPIAPNADQRVQIEYYQELDADHDWFRYVYPLATTTRPQADTRTTGRFAFSLEAKSEVPIASVESPSHSNDVVVATHGADHVQASLERKGGRLDRDVVIDLHAARPKTGIDMITSRAGREDGYFLLTLTAGEDLAQLDTGMDYVFVLDSSGSMGDDGKLAISKESVLAFLRTLDAEDRFEVMTFNIQPYPLFKALQTPDVAALKRAGDYLDAESARGGTVLNPAMTTAYKYGSPDRPLNVVVLSDGLTEQRERAELLQLIRERPRNARVFCIGVGNDVNRPLLEQMAEDSGGLAAFLSRADNFDRQAQAFRRKLTRPAASGVQLEIQGVEVYDVEPAVLPDLHHGAPVRVYGRYRGAGTAQVAVKADVRGVAFRQAAKLAFPADDARNPEIERMWAWKRIDRLLKTADRAGSRTPVTAEIVALGEAYSIVTEYTSFLVLENDDEYRRWKIERRNADRTGRDRAAQARREAELETLRRKAMADIGPQPVERTAAARPVPQAPAAAPAQAPSSPAPAVNTPPPQASNRSRGFDFDFGLGGGSGPVGPLFVLVSAWIARRRRNG